jgi:8-oxo-dGTP pyrophosphatase MutT (NUDIX family)
VAQYAYGERIGRTAQLKLGCAAIIPDDTGRNIVLTRRTDNGRWCLPGGAMDPGESLEECCRREVWEETGLIVRVVRLIGIYSTPHRVTYYADGPSVADGVCDLSDSHDGGHAGSQRRNDRGRLFLPGGDGAAGPD